MKTLAAAAVLVLAAALPAGAQDEKEHAVLTSAEVDNKNPKVGETFHLVLKISLDEHWHMMAAELGDPAGRARLEFGKDAPIERAGKTLEPEPKHTKTEFVEYWAHEGNVTLKYALRLKEPAKPGPLKLTGKFLCQVCDPNMCMYPGFPIAVDITVAEGKVTPVQQDATGAASDEYEQKGLGWLLGISVIGGLVSLIMPCVYPLIPITLTFFVKQAGASRAQGMLLSSSYALGIIVTFTGLGFLLTFLLGAQGATIFASNPWVNLGIAVAFGIFALSLFGLFELQLPQFLTGLTGGGPKSGVVGAFVLGLLFSVVAFTCVIPIAATILGIAASGGHKLAGLLAMLVYSSVMALPFMFLGLFPAMIKEIPKSGGWLHTVKVTSAFLELALAIGYIWKADLIWGWGIFDRWRVLAIWIGISFVTALYLFGMFRMKGDGEQKEIGFPRMATGLLFGIMGFILLGGLFGRPVGVFNVVLPPEMDGGKTSGTHEPLGARFFSDLAEAEKAAKDDNKPLFVEFTGVT